MIDSNFLYYLVVFQETGSLSKASETLHLSQPSLSKAMQKLENELGVNIFDRTVNKLSLNQCGEEVLSFAKDITRMIIRLEERAKEMKDRTCSLSIGLIAPGPLYVFSSLFAPHSLGLKTTTEIAKEEDLMKGLMNSSYDLIFLNRPMKETDIVCKKVMTEHLYISVPPTHFLAKLKQGIFFSEADGQTFVNVAEIGVWMDILKKHMSKSRFVTVNSPLDVKEIVEYSSIPSFVSDATMKYHAATNRINIPFLDEDAKMTFYAACKKKDEAILSKLY